MHDSACAPDSILWLSFQLQDSGSLHRWPVWKYLQYMCTRFNVVTVFSVWAVWEVPAVHVHQIQHCDCLFSFKPVIHYINDQFERYLQWCAPNSVLWLSFQLQASDSLHRWPVWEVPAGWEWVEQTTHHWQQSALLLLLHQSIRPWVGSLLVCLFQTTLPSGFCFSCCSV